jgi:TPR repeat protein
MRPIPVLLSLLTLCLLGPLPVLAQYEDGQKAFDSGDYAAAQVAWQKGAEANDARSEYSLGYLAQFGLAGAADLGAARSWYEKAAVNNSADAFYALGLMYETGQAGEKDLARAFDLYHKAVAAGPQSDAEYAIGRMLLRGRGVPRDAKESVVWLKKAAQHGNPAGQYMLAEAYEAGWGVRADEGEAYYWYRRADQGDPVELQEQDVSFEPKIAIAALRRRLPADLIADYDAKLKHDMAAAKAKPKAKSEAKPAPKPAAKPDTAAQPDALTKQTR